ncbi:MAG: VPLPA-CTERM sorting domain-containing protein [Pseudomonadota bacterium]
MTIKEIFVRPVQTCALLCAAALLAPHAATAASLTIDSFAGTHFHTGGNVGFDYTQTSIEDRTADIPITPGGLAFLSTRDVYSGEIPSVASTRLGRGEATANTVGLVQDDGFFFAGDVESVSTCTFKDQLTGCVPFMTSQARVTMDFSTDMAGTLFLDGFWQGGNGTESLVSTVDFFSLAIQELPPSGGALNLINVDTNLFNRLEQGGIFDGTVNLEANKNYRFSFFHSASSQSPDASGASDSDGGSFAFSASFVQSNDVAFFNSELDGLVMSAVPLPAGGLLLISALGGVAAFRRRKGA